MPAVFQHFNSVTDIAVAINFYELDALREDLVQWWHPAGMTDVADSKSLTYMSGTPSHAKKPISTEEVSDDPKAAIIRLIDIAELVNEINDEKAQYLKKGISQVQSPSNKTTVATFLRALIMTEKAFEDSTLVIC